MLTTGPTCRTVVAPLEVERGVLCECVPPGPRCSKDQHSSTWGREVACHQDCGLGECCCSEEQVVQLWAYVVEYRSLDQASRRRPPRFPYPTTGRHRPRARYLGSFSLTYILPPCTFKASPFTIFHRPRLMRCFSQLPGDWTSTSPDGRDLTRMGALTRYTGCLSCTSTCYNNTCKPYTTQSAISDYKEPSRRSLSSAWE